MKFCHHLWRSLCSLYVLGLLLSFHNCKAQNSLEFNALSGLKLFSDEVTFPGNSYGMEVAYNLSQKNKKTDWVRRLSIRDIAIVGGYYNMGNVSLPDSVTSKGFLGSLYTLSCRLNINILSIKNTELLLITGTGLTYSTSSFFKDGNPVVGSNINTVLQCGLSVRTKLYKTISLTAGGGIFHYSNTGYQIPNSGVNSYYVSLGVAKDLKQGNRVYEERPVDNIKGAIDIMTDVGRRGGYKSRFANWKSGLSIGYNYKLNSVFSLRSSLDAVYYKTPYDNTIKTYQHLATSYDPWRLGVSIGGDVWLGKFVVMGSFGRYIYFNSRYPVSFYSMGALKYYFKPWLGVQARIYLHRAQADYAGLGIIFRVPTQKVKRNI